MRNLTGKMKGRLLGPSLVFLLILSCATTALAQGRVVAQKPVDIIVRSAFVLLLQVGSPGGTVDVVRFDVSALPGSGPVKGVSSGQNPVPVIARAVFLSGQMVLTADSFAPLNDGHGNTIPFTEIGWKGTGIMPSTTFSGTTHQLLFTTSRSRARGTMSFYYKNTMYLPAGTYSGRVTFTLSSP